jgi:parvulin-like peptidyl-prolyl isomerase
VTARKRLEAGDNFSAVSAEMSQDMETRKNGGKISGWVENRDGETIPAMEEARDAIKAIFVTDPGQVVKEDISSKKGIHIIKVIEREPERQKPFEEVKNEVYMALRGAKEQEVHQALLKRLKDQYDVVVHESSFSEF